MPVSRDLAWLSVSQVHIPWPRLACIAGFGSAKAIRPHSPNPSNIAILSRPARKASTRLQTTRRQSHCSPLTSTHHVSRLRLVLAPPKLWQGRPWLPCLHPQVSRARRLNSNAMLTFMQGRSHPQVWPEHLPSVLPRKGHRHWLPQGTQFVTDMRRQTHGRRSGADSRPQHK